MTTTEKRCGCRNKKLVDMFLNKKIATICFGRNFSPSRCQLLYLDAERKGALHLRLARGSPGGLLNQPEGVWKNCENSRGDIISKWLD